MNPFDQQQTDAAAEARQRLLDAKYTAAISRRYETDYIEARRALAKAANVSEDQVPDEVVEQRVERLGVARSYFSARTGIARGLPTSDPAVHEMDVRAARAHVAAVEAELEDRLPEATLARLDGVRMDSQVRRDVEKLLRDGNDEALDQYILVRRTVDKPGGGRADMFELRAWHPDAWPAIDDPAELKRRLGAGGAQQTLRQFRDSTRIREMIKLRFPDAEQTVDWMKRKM